MTHSTYDEWLWGVDVYFVTPCRCGCTQRRVHPHSMKSNLPIWKCAWCGKRKGKLTDEEIELLEDFLHRFGWTMEPLVFHENGIVYAHCPCPRCGKQNPVFDGKMAKCQRCRQKIELSIVTTNFLEKTKALWGARAEVTLRNSKKITNLIEQHDEYLKSRGDYDIISSTLLGEDWQDDRADDGLYDDCDSGTEV
jgi:hypothetical protein